MSEEEFAKMRHDAFLSLRQSVHAVLEENAPWPIRVVIEDGEVLQIGPEEIAKRLEEHRTSNESVRCALVALEETTNEY